MFPPPPGPATPPTPPPPGGGGRARPARKTTSRPYYPISVRLCLSVLQPHFSLLSFTSFCFFLFGVWLPYTWRNSSCRVVRASGCLCQSCDSRGFNPSILRHSGIWGASDEAVLNKVMKRKKEKKSPFQMKKMGEWNQHLKESLKRRISFEVLHKLISIFCSWADSFLMQRFLF